MWLLTTDIQTQRREKIFDFSIFFFIFFNRLNIIRSGWQKYGFIISRLLRKWDYFRPISTPGDEGIKIRFFHIFLFDFLRTHTHTHTYMYTYIRTHKHFLENAYFDSGSSEISKIIEISRSTNFTVTKLSLWESRILLRKRWNQMI